MRTAYSVEVSEGKRDRLPRNATLDMLYVQGDVENTSGAAGESARLIHEIKPAQEGIDDKIKGFWREIDRLARLRPRGKAGLSNLENCGSAARANPSSCDRAGSSRRPVSAK